MSANHDVWDTNSRDVNETSRQLLHRVPRINVGVPSFSTKRSWSSIKSRSSPPRRVVLALPQAALCALKSPVTKNGGGHCRIIVFNLSASNEHDGAIYAAITVNVSFPFLTVTLTYSLLGCGWMLCETYVKSFRRARKTRLVPESRLD